MANNIDGRSEDMVQGLVTEILFRLPVKSLLRLMCVSKGWYALIGNSDFIIKNFNRRDNVPHLLIRFYEQAINGDTMSCHDLESLAPVDVNFVSFTLCNYTYMIGPMNGMFFLLDSEYPNMALYNPATRELRRVVEPHIILPYYVYGICHVFGFGEDILTNHYKLIWIQSFYDEQTTYNCNIVAVYNINTDSWNVFESTLSCSYMSPSLCNTYKNGFRYWNAGPDVECTTIVSFDLSKEKFQESLLPPDISELPFKKLVMYNDLIATISVGTPEEKCFTLWVMEDESFWTKQLIVGPLDQDIYWPLGISPNDQFFLKTKDDQVVVYNNNSINVTDIGFYKDPQIFFYKESLILVKRESNAHNE